MEGFQVQKTSYIRVVDWWDGEIYRMMVCLVGRRLGLKMEERLVAVYLSLESPLR
jgi:hypothetical protein